MSTITHPNANETSNSTVKIVAVLGFAAVLFCIVWASGGLNFLTDYAGAEKACLDFVEETHTNPALEPYPADKKIFVVDKWTKSGNVVIQLGQKSAEGGGKYFQSRLCVVGGGYVRLPGMFQEWQYNK